MVIVGVELAADLPPGDGAVCTFMYALPARMAAITSLSSLRPICCVATGVTLAAFHVPLTVPSCGHSGVFAATCAGARDVPWQIHSTMPPFTSFWAT